MKLLLIILSILLLYSPVIGDNHKGETLYGWGKCCDYVWKGFGDKGTNPKYKGGIENGLHANGSTRASVYGITFTD